MNERLPPVFCEALGLKTSAKCVAGRMVFAPNIIRCIEYLVQRDATKSSLCLKTPIQRMIAVQNMRFYPHFVDMDFAGSVAEEGIVTAWRLAHKHGLRMLVGSQLLPRSAPQGKRRVHIPVLDGSRIRDPDARRVSIAVLDPAFAAISNPNQWIRDQLGTQSASDDLSSLASDRLKRWFREFTKIDPKGA